MNENISVATNAETANEDITIFNSHPIDFPRYEKIRWPYYLSLPFMWILTVYVMIKKKIFKLLGMPAPRINSFFFDGLGLASRKVKEYAASWRAMEIIYNHNFPVKITVRGIVDEFYWHGLNCQGLRNRYKLVKHELRKAIAKLENTKEIRLASLACGAGQAVIEIVSEYKKKNVIIKAILMDIDQAALDSARAIALKNGVADQIEVRQTNLSEEESVLKGFKPQIIEMLGFLDYNPQEEAIRFVKKLYEALDDKGILITCNIHPNIEQYFIKWVINWPMVYRKPGDLLDVAKKAGFKDYRVIYEPLKIHGLLIADK
jgi:chemotaxis methyl-accepting protein methylase